MILELLTQIVQFFWDFIPRPELVGPSERAACFWFGRYGRDKGPGFYIVWPLIQIFHKHCVVSQICETAVVPVSDSSGNDWQWRLAIEYELSDVLLYETSCYSAQNHLEQCGAYALVRIISEHTTDQLLNRPISIICNKIAEQISEQAAKTGIRVIRVRSIMATRCLSVFLSQAERLAV